MPKVREIGRKYRKQARALAALEHSTNENPKIDVISQKVIGENFYSFDAITYRYERFEGHMSEPIVREVLVTGDCGILLPYDPVLDAVVLIEQARPAALVRGSSNAWSYEPIAGFVDENETAAQTIMREAQEEAGLQIQELFELPSGYQSPGCLSQKQFVFIGKCDLSTFEPGVYGLEEENENIKTHCFSRLQALQLFQEGKIDVVPLQVALLGLELNRQEILRAFA